MIVQVDDLKHFKKQALGWAASFGVCCVLDSNNFNDRYSKFDCLIAAGAKNELLVNEPRKAFSDLEAFRKTNTGWITGFLTYDLKNEVEHLKSDNKDILNFPALYFFEPQYLLLIKDNRLEIITGDAQFVIQSINNQKIAEADYIQSPEIKARFTKQEYLGTVELIKERIIRGDIYVTNFCQEFYAEDCQINPLHIYGELNHLSPNPFASFFKLKNKYILCASPERFLAKRETRLISQPIKGTAKRGVTCVEDELIRQQLKDHPKEQQENVMIVDLVRNDLTKSAKEGSVETTELFGVYTFEHIFQMMSTIECELKDDINSVEAIRNSFPMGSMTGAPKLSAMQLMEKLERTKRGIYSGAIGYFSPDNDFDFNVVIRSVLYNADNKYLSFQTGSAITYHCDAEQEYEECLLKAKAIFKTLSNRDDYFSYNCVSKKANND